MDKKACDRVYHNKMTTCIKLLNKTTKKCLKSRTLVLISN